MRHRGWLELRRATEVLTSFGLAKKEHESMVNILQRAAQGDRTDGRVSRKNFLKEAASQSPNRSLKSRSPGAGGTKASWSCLRGVVRFGSTGLTGPGQKEKSDFAAWNLWPAKAEELPRSPTSSRPSSPRSQETKSSPHRTPEASLSPSRSYRDLWWQIAPNAASARPARSLTPNSWKAVASRAEQEGRAQAAAEIALLRMNAGIPVVPRQDNSATPREVLNSPSVNAASPTSEQAVLSSISTSVGTEGSTQSSPRHKRRAEEVSCSGRSSHRQRGDAMNVTAQDVLPARALSAPSVRGPVRPKVESEREQSKWAPCKWPPSSRWPSSQLPPNVNKWPLEGDDKPAGLDTWTHILFTNGLRCSPSDGQKPTSICRKGRNIEPRRDGLDGPCRTRSARSLSARESRARSASHAPLRTPSRSPRSLPGSPRSPPKKSPPASPRLSPRSRPSKSKSQQTSGYGRNAANRKLMASSRPQERRGNIRRERSTDAPQRPLGYKQKPTPADLVRMQRELQSQIEMVNRALDGASVPRTASKTPRQQKDRAPDLRGFRF